MLRKILTRISYILKKISKIIDSEKFYTFATITAIFGLVLINGIAYTLERRLEASFAVIESYAEMLEEKTEENFKEQAEQKIEEISEIKYFYIVRDFFKRK